MSRRLTESANYSQDHRGKTIYQQTPDEKWNTDVDHNDGDEPACSLGDAGSEKRQEG